MLDLATVRDFHAAAPLRDSREVSGEGVIVVLRPAIRGMRVTARAGDLRAEKKLPTVSPRSRGSLARV
ncbi:MAG: hypothetical protein M3463_17550 [Verrucomicrobiota bacterium]|nr:hypothetical protein [Verrucomicrobiota bacterium]